MIDEAHQILTQKASKEYKSNGQPDENGEENDNALEVFGKEDTFRELIRGWIANSRTTVVSLTATPLINTMSDVAKLLNLVNPNVVSSGALLRFETVLNGLTDFLMQQKMRIERQETPIAIDPAKIHGSLFELMSLRELVLHPLIERATWDDPEVQQSCFGQIPIKLELKKKLHLQGKQAELIGEVCSEVCEKGFLAKSHLIKRYLIHPSFESEAEVKLAAERFPSFTAQAQNEFLEQSAFLTELFLNLQSELPLALQRREKALLFVEHKDTAALLKVIAQNRFRLPENRVVVIHSDVPKADEKIAAFKAIRNEPSIHVGMRQRSNDSLYALCIPVLPSV